MMISNETKKIEEIDWENLKKQKDNPKMTCIDYEGAKSINAHSFRSEKLAKVTKK